MAAKDGGDLAPRLISAFRKRYPQISVNIIKAPASTDTQRSALSTQLAAGSTTPDVYQGDITWAAQFGAASFALPVESLLDEEEWQRYPKALLTSLGYQGHRYAFPCTRTSRTSTTAAICCTSAGCGCRAPGRS